MAIQAFGLIFFAAVAIGMPLYLALGSTATLMYWLSGDPLIGVFQKMLDGMNSDTLLAVPFFVMAATFMEKGGVAKAMIDFVALLIGRVRGGMAIVTVTACTLFSAICGSSVATAMAMGAILYPAMTSRNYPKPFALGIIAASGTLGILVPPSLAMIIYALIAEESVPRLFLAGIVPGLLQAGLFIGYAMIFAHRHKLPREDSVNLDAANKRQIILRALPALSLPLIVAVGIYGGFTTVTEASVLTAMVSLLISVFVYRGFTLRDLLSEVSKAISSAAVITAIIASALVFGHWLTASGIPARIVNYITEIGLQPWQFLLIVNVILLCMGMFLETVSIMLITLPILVPLLGPLGISPIHFAIVITINMELALLTPPVGLNLFVLSNVSKEPLSAVTRGGVPLIALMFLLLGVVTYIPEISLWLPRLVYGN